MHRNAPIARQYHAKGCNFPFSKQRMAGPIAANPVRQDATKPIKYEEGDIGKTVICSESLSKVRQFPPRIVGIDSKKEKRTASCAFQPRMRAHEIVEALREIPGIRAVDCRRPIQTASLALLFQAIDACLWMRRCSPANKRRDVTNKV